MRRCGSTVSRAWIDNQEECLWEDKIISLVSNLNALGSPSELCEMDRNRMAPEAQPDDIEAGKATAVCFNILRYTRSQAAINNVDFHSHLNQIYSPLRCIRRWQTMILDAMLAIPTVEIKSFNPHPWSSVVSQIKHVDGCPIGMDDFQVQHWQATFIKVCLERVFCCRERPIWLSPRTWSRTL
jgi:hypothetical protein